MTATPQKSTSAKSGRTTGLLPTRRTKISILFMLFGAFLLLSIFVVVVMLGIERQFSGFPSEVVIVIVLFVFIPSLLLSFFIAQNLGRPIRDIDHAIREVAKGNFDINLETARTDELGNLAALFNDMTARLRETDERNRALTDSKTQFLMVAAHQLRTPSTSVNWGLNLMLDGQVGPVTEDQKQVLTESLGANERMISIVDDLMNVAKVEEADFAYEFRNAELTPVIEKVIEMFVPEAKKKNMKITFDNQLPDGFSFIADMDRLKIVIENFIENALWYSKNDTPIEVTARKDDDRVVVAVTNHGAVMSEEDKKRIFTRFFRSKEAIKQHADGSGLGLYLSKTIIERHEGELTFDSDAEGKTTFSFSVPIHAEAPKHLESFMSEI